MEQGHGSGRMPRPERPARPAPPPRREAERPAQESGRELPARPPRPDARRPQRPVLEPVPTLEGGSVMSGAAPVAGPAVESDESKAAAPTGVGVWTPDLGPAQPGAVRRPGVPPGGDASPPAAPAAPQPKPAPEEAAPQVQQDEAAESAELGESLSLKHEAAENEETTGQTGEKEAEAAGITEAVTKDLDTDEADAGSITAEADAIPEDTAKASDAPPEDAGARAMRAAWPLPESPPPGVEVIETVQYLPPEDATPAPPKAPPKPPAPKAAPTAPPADSLEALQAELRRKRRREGILLEWVASLFIALVGAIILTQVVFVSARVPTESMEDTIRVGDRLIGLRLAYLVEPPQRGDIIIFKCPDDESQSYVKRVVALPGEEVEIKDGRVYINGAKAPLEEDWVKGVPTGDFGPYKVPEGQYFVLGDNRENSWDSRYWENTCVDKIKIIGRVLFRLYPEPGRVA